MNPKTLKYSKGSTSSKQSNGKNSQNSSTKVHAVPFGGGAPSAAFNKFSDIFSPAGLGKVSEPADTSIVADADVSQYRLQTGIFENEPLVILLSEFVPLYDNDEQVNQSLSIKEKSLIVTARNACLSMDSKEVIDLLTKNQSEINDFVKSSKRLANVLKAMSSLYEILKVQNFKSSSGVTVNELLSRFGNKTSTYTSTKIWLQTLLELKKKVQFYTPHLISATYPEPPPSADDPYLITGVGEPGTTETKIWITSYETDYPEMEDLLSSADDASLDKSIAVTKAAYKKLYVDLDSTKESAIIKSANNFLDSYIGTGRDVSILATLLTKEANYSKVILDLADMLQSKYGYLVTSNDQQAVFDHLIGTFTKSAWDASTNPVGLGNSLASLANEIVKNPETNKESVVLTFEPSFSFISNMTPGADYYVESSLKTNDGSNFSITNLRRLQEKIKAAQASLDVLKRLQTGDSGVASNRSNAANKSSTSGTKFSSTTGPTKSLSDKFSAGTSFSAVSIIDKAIPQLANAKSSLAGSTAMDPVRGFSSTDMLLDMYGEFDFLRKIYVEMYKTTLDETIPYTQNEESTLERMTAGIFKLCVSPTKLVKDKAADARAILYLMLGTQYVNINDELRGNILSALKKKFLRLLELKTDQLPESALTADVRDISYTVTFDNMLKSKVWTGASRLMNDYSKIPAYDQNGRTAYSKIKKSILMLCFFDMIARILTTMSPENTSGHIVLFRPT